MKYHTHLSLNLEFERNIDKTKFDKWTIHADIIWFDASDHQIFHGRRGFSIKRLTIGYVFPYLLRP